MLSQALLFARTARHLRPAQVAHRVRLRAQRAAVARFPDAATGVLAQRATSAPGWPRSFVPLDGRLVDVWPRPDDVAEGRLTLLGVSRQVGHPPDWSQTAAPRLWRFHLHYWDWVWGLAQDADRARARRLFSELWGSCPAVRRLDGGDCWSPYVASLRAWSLCGLHGPLAAGTELEPELIRSLGLHAGYLRRHLERDVGGNHLVKNLKALAGLGVFLDDERLLAAALRDLARQVVVQVLPDGGHYERAPAYHCQVLGDLVDVAALLAAAGRPVPDWLIDAVAVMRRWLGIVLLPDGTVPLLNDGFPLPAGLLDLLAPGPRAPDGHTVLPDTGLVVLRSGDLHVLADVGDPCPADLPAHAHADTLGFLLHVGRQRVVTELGTSTYDPGPRRDLERGTGGHSTVQVDGLDSTEVWGAFRAARRARPHLLRVGLEGRELVVAASHDGYSRRPGRVVHVRIWRLSPQGLRLVDEVTGRGLHHVVTRLHLDGGVDPVRPAGLQVRASVRLDRERIEPAVGWGRVRPAHALVGRDRVRLPWRAELILSREEVP